MELQKTVHCPVCECDNTRVLDSRQSDGRIRRRRQCAECEERFTTYESIERKYPYIIKSDASREEYRQEKLLRSVELAMRKRPITTPARRSLLFKIEQQLQDCKAVEIEAKWLGELVMKELLELDRVAYIRYASVYRSFEDVYAFLAEIQQIEGMLSPEIRDSQLDLFAGDREDKT